jgi:hypothetical protein
MTYVSGTAYAKRNGLGVRCCDRDVDNVTSSVRVQTNKPMDDAAAESAYEMTVTHETSSVC